MVAGGTREAWCRWGRRCGRGRGEIRMDATAPSSAKRCAVGVEEDSGRGGFSRTQDARIPGVTHSSGGPAVPNACGNVARTRSNEA
jgi:hypothetical protein